MDQNRSPRLAELLRGAGHDAVHTLEVGLERSNDDELLAVANRERRVLITGDADFGAVLALTLNMSPSVVLFRARRMPDACSQASVVLERLDNLADDLPPVPWSSSRTIGSVFDGSPWCTTNDPLSRLDAEASARRSPRPRSAADD